MINIRMYLVALRTPRNVEVPTEDSVGYSAEGGAVDRGCSGLG